MALTAPSLDLALANRRLRSAACATVALSPGELRELRDALEAALADGVEDEAVLEGVARAAILSADRDRAKTAVELLGARFAGNELARALLPAINTSLSLDAAHDTFAVDAAANRAQNERELDARASQLDSTPHVIEIASTNVCNIMPPCVHCWKHVDPAHGYLNDDAYHMPKELIRRLAPWIARARFVSLHGIGEPLAHPQLFDSVKHVGDDTEVSFVSNALLLTPERIAKILDNRVAMIDFSLDAATPETFRRIRNSDFEAAIDGILRLIAERDRRGLDRPRICINMCLMRENVSEVPEFVRLAKRLGVARAHVFHMNKGASYRAGWFDYEAQHCEHDAAQHDAAIEEGLRLAEQLGVPLVFSGKRRLASGAAGTAASAAADTAADVAVEPERFFCSKPWTSLLVQNNGDVYNCCWQDRPIDNLGRASLWEVWNGATLREVRESTARGEPHPVCVNTKGNLCPYLGRV